MSAPMTWDEVGDGRELRFTLDEACCGRDGDHWAALLEVLEPEKSSPRRRTPRPRT